MGQLDQDAKNLEQQIDQMDKRLDRLRSIYEQYFQGIERAEPHMERVAIKQVIQTMRTTSIRSTILRFRINQLVAKFNTYENYWSRVTRQIEEGTYQKDLFKARYHSKQRQGESSDATDEQEQIPGAEITQKIPSPPAAVPNLSEDQIGLLYKAYSTARQRCKESVQGLTQESLAVALRKQIPQIIKQYKCKSVEFKVVIKEGKAILKAVPKF